MNYLHFLDHLGIEQRNIVKQNGFILPSLLISVTISSFVILMLVMICMTCFILTERIDSMTSVNEDGHILSIKDDKHTTFTVVRRALYRKLSDGSLQPLSGSRIIGTDDKRKVDGIQPFSINTNKLLRLKWVVNNRFNSRTEYAKGYGGIANYEVATAVSTHSDWFKKKQEL